MEQLLFQSIIGDLDVGNSVAENDNLLENARVNTEVFWDVYERGKYDIIPSTKGSGKTAIFKLISKFKAILLKERNLIILTGVNISGEPIFNKYRDKLKKFTEAEFENEYKGNLFTQIDLNTTKEQD